MHRNLTPSSHPTPLSVALIILAVGLCPSYAARSTARETPVPPHIHDHVPGEPPPPAPEPEPEPESEPEPEPEPEPPVEIEPLPAEPTIALPDTDVLRFISPKPNGIWRDRETVTIRWIAPELATQVRIYYYGERCQLGGKDRGRFSGVVKGDMLPNTGHVAWQVPWLDGPALRLRIGAYDAAGKQIAAHEIPVLLLPREFGDLPDTCIAISKRLQRLYYFEGGRIRRMHMISTAVPPFQTPKMKPGSRGSRGAMGKVFNKALNPFSSLYRVHMPYWLGITSSGSHGIHATSPGYYRLLGRPASHGCVRQHKADAQVLYSMVSVGTPVYIY
jgi:hypothetical protein